MIQLELASQLEHDLLDAGNCGRKWLLDFSSGKTQLVFFDWSVNSSAVCRKMDGSVLDEKSSFSILRLSLYFKLDWGLLHFLYY